MAMTIDNLRVDHRVTILSDFTDADGVTLRVGEVGVLRKLAFDHVRQDILMEIEREKGKISLRFPLRMSTGPRNGHMKEYFEVSDYVPVPGTERVPHDYSARKMIVPPPEKNPASADGTRLSRFGKDLDGPDRLEDVENQIQREAQHIGAAASIAEMYAQRMRAFQRAGNEPRAVAAFKLAAQWIWTYASQATSGGEGAALSYERDQFHAALVREFGYDPTESVGESRRGHLP